MVGHAHSHRTRRRGPRVYTEAELRARARRLERRAARETAEKPAEVRVRVVERTPGYMPAGQQSGRIGRNPYALPWYVKDALSRQAAEAARAAAGQ